MKNSELTSQRSKKTEKTSSRLTTREALIRCGVELCTQSGFQATGIEEVLQRVNVPKGSFYHYFRNKREFGKEVINSYAEYFRLKLARHFTNTALAPLDRLRAFIDEAQAGMMKFDFKRGCLIGNLGQELAGLDEEFRQSLEQVLLSWEQQTAACLREAQQQRHVHDKQKPELLAAVFWIGWEGAILRSKLTKSSKPMQLFADFFLESLRN
mgnify:CR=1 FL=1